MSTLKRGVANKVIKMSRDASKMTKSDMLLDRPLGAARWTTARQDVSLTLSKVLFVHRSTALGRPRVGEKGE